MVKSNNKTSTNTSLQIDLPDKKYFTIGEVADLCQLKSHVLRYWEQVFPQLEPSKRRGRRYYQRGDVELILDIRRLLHDQGFTIPGAKARLSKSVVDIADNRLSCDQKNAVEILQSMQSEIQEFRCYIKKRF